MKVHIEVTGMRGKSGLITFMEETLRSRKLKTLAKVTGFEPLVIYNGKKFKVERKFKNYFLDEENRTILDKFNDYEIAIFENPGITRYTMTAFSKLYKPDILVIPNIRYEHLKGLGDTREQIVESFARHLRFSKTAIVSEDIPCKEILDSYAQKFNTKLIYTNCSGRDIVEEIVNTRVNLTNKILEILGQEKLSSTEINNLQERVRSEFKLKKSVKYGIDYFDASKVNDIESMSKVFEYLAKQTTKKFAILSYFRRDRLDRTFTFQTLLSEWISSPKVYCTYLSGYYYKPLLNHLKQIDKLKVMEVDDETVKYVLQTVQNRNLVLLLTVNSVNKFMDKVREMIQ